MLQYRVIAFRKHIDHNVIQQAIKLRWSPTTPMRVSLKFQPYLLRRFEYPEKRILSISPTSASSKLRSRTNRPGLRNLHLCHKNTGTQRKFGERNMRHSGHWIVEWRWRKERCVRNRLFYLRWDLEEVKEFKLQLICNWKVEILTALVETHPTRHSPVFMLASCRSDSFSGSLDFLSLRQ